MGEATKNSVDEPTASSIEEKKIVHLDDVKEEETETLTDVKTKETQVAKKEEKTVTTASAIQHSVSAPTVSEMKDKKNMNLDDVKDAETEIEAESKESVATKKEETKADLPFNTLFNPLLIKILKKLADAHQKYGCEMVQNIKCFGLDKDIENSDLFKEYVPKFEKIGWNLNVFAINKVKTLSIEYKND